MERIHVTVRARPLSLEDAKTSPWKISSNSISIPNHSYKFEFDKIFSENCKTAEVYEARTKVIVSAAVRGFNGTVFAYGQTNSGKTHTMRGSKSEPGIIPRAVHDLFQIIQQDVDREFLLRMSYMEIYNEEINDLLAPEHRKLQIHESPERGIYVAGLREEIVASPEQVLDLMEFGESHRHIGETNMNLYSSRSHTIFRMIIESRDRSEDEGNDNSIDAVRVSVLNLVDLAGSERAAKTGAEGVRLKEGSHINKSLMTLGTVIKKLSEDAENQGGHVPYRDSKLTRILQPALGGNANTAIICNITLAQIHADETKSSLQFASRALRVTNCAQVNEVSSNPFPMFETSFAFISFFSSLGCVERDISCLLLECEKIEYFLCMNKILYDFITIYQCCQNRTGKLGTSLLSSAG
ncbi:putative plus-end-directed kinesin ATPase [Lupinus albus]|uniref:Kinesin-like protein n=1 Tax=Lupinus albus TaxID=3870 RepID=A0A6A4N863_LUPAL|nr:putative plus-end-directed kinesin ATPase [Lupinus albus]